MAAGDLFPHPVCEKGDAHLRSCVGLGLLNIARCVLVSGKWQLASSQGVSLGSLVQRQI